MTGRMSSHALILGRALKGEQRKSCLGKVLKEKEGRYAPLPFPNPSNPFSPNARFV